MMLPLLFVFFIIYNALYSGVNRHVDLQEFITSPERIIWYLAPQTSGQLGEDRADTGPIGRIDSLVFPLVALSEDPTKLFFGVGLGNTAKSRFDFFRGEYAAESEDGRIIHGASRILWEFGLFGMLLFLLLPIMQCLECRRLNKRGLTGDGEVIAWYVINLLIIFSLFYKDIFTNLIMGVYFYVTGAMLCKVYFLKQKARLEMRKAAEAEA